MRRMIAVGFWLGITLRAAHAGELPLCVGDCNGNGRVAVNEAIVGVNIALGNAPVDDCRSFDRNGDGLVGIAELIAAIGGILNGCMPAVETLRLVPVGDEFIANATPDGGQFDAQAALADDGDFVVVWSGNTAEDSFGIAARHFSGDGTTATQDFAVNTYTAYIQRNPDVAAQPDGQFLVVWESGGLSPITDPSQGIFARRYGADAVALGNQFQLDATSDIADNLPAAAPLTDGGYVVVWVTGLPSDATTNVLYGRRLGLDGLPLGDQFVVNHYTPFQTRPAVAGTSDGGFVVVWEDAYRDGDNFGVFGQRFDAAGALSGPDFRVAEATVSIQRRPSIAATPGGGFVVAWASYEVHARRFAADGTPLGGDFQVNSADLGQQGYPSVASEPDGGFLVTWQTDRGGGPFNIVGQRFGPGGARIGEEFQVNTFSSLSSTRSACEVATNADGQVLVVWQGGEQDGPLASDLAVIGQRYELVP